jgi:orotidine-5'-phosphate decarboxylase
MNFQQIVEQIKKKGTYLCVGLDTEYQKIPVHLRAESDPVFAFNKQIIDATQDRCVAYKPNLAFYEAQGLRGWESLQKTIEYIPKDIFIIADAKRGDIGNTSRLYAQAFFQQLNADAVTVAPYMGEDSVKPFLEFEGKWVVLLAHTSNSGSADFQLLKTSHDRTLYEEVILKAQQWSTPQNLMFVVGATQEERIRHIRSLAPEHFFLVPGVGAQGGDLSAVSRLGMNASCGLLVNASRSILYASGGKDFATAARTECLRLGDEMNRLLQQYT